MSTNALCRLCGKNTKDYIDIFDENGLKKDLSVKASSCLNINVYPNDVLPKIMCVTCCARLDDLYEFLERSTKVQLILRTLYQSSGLTSVVSAEHDYAIKIPAETRFPVPQALLKEEYDVPLPNCIDDEQERSKLDIVHQRDLGSASAESMLLEEDNNEEFNSEMEHNYFLPCPELQENRSAISLVQEMEHNYYVRTDRNARDNGSMQSMCEAEIDNDFHEPTLSQILEGYSWPCTICHATDPLFSFHILMPGMFEKKEQSHKLVYFFKPLRSHKMKHKGATFVRCNRCQHESIGRRIFIRHKLQKAPTGDQCEDCKVKFSQKTARRGRTISDITKKSCNGQRRRNRDSEQRFIFSLRRKTFSTAYRMEHKGECLLGSIPSNQGERRHCRCASRTRFFKTARIVTNNLPYTCEHSSELL